MVINKNCTGGMAAHMYHHWISCSDLVCWYLANLYKMSKNWYSQKIWWEAYLVKWPPNDCKWILAEFKIWRLMIALRNFHMFSSCIFRSLLTVAVQYIKNNCCWPRSNINIDNFLTISHYCYKIYVLFSRLLSSNEPIMRATYHIAGIFCRGRGNFYVFRGLVWAVKI